MQQLKQLLEELFAGSAFIKAVLSKPVKAVEARRVTLRPVELKQGMRIQFETESGSKVFHENIVPEKCPEAVVRLLSQFEELHLFTHEADYFYFRGKLRKKASSLKKTSLQHNREKQYLLDSKAPIWKALGLAVSGMQGKFRQVEKFVEIAGELIRQLPKRETIRIVDFGCGKGYLTFALADYLKRKEIPFQIVGVDLKEDLMGKLNGLASQQGYEGLHFRAGSIENYALDESTDLVIGLHACDVATDFLLAKAVKAKVPGILSVPCCQHELAKMLSQPILSPLLKHGILRERFAALATDAMRAELLQSRGYKTQVLEFVDTEHTPKNLLIRALKSGSGEGEKSALLAYSALAEFLSAEPILKRLLER